MEQVLKFILCNTSFYVKINEMFKTLSRTENCSDYDNGYSYSDNACSGQKKMITDLL